MYRSRSVSFSMRSIVWPVMAENAVQVGAQPQDFLGLDGDVRRLSARVAQRLMEDTVALGSA